MYMLLGFGRKSSERWPRQGAARGCREGTGLSGGFLARYISRAVLMRKPRDFQVQGFQDWGFQTQGSKRWGFKPRGALQASSRFKDGQQFPAASKAAGRTQLLLRVPEAGLQGCHQQRVLSPAYQGHRVARIGGRSQVPVPSRKQGQTHGLQAQPERIVLRSRARGGPSTGQPPWRCGPARRAWTNPGSAAC